MKRFSIVLTTMLALVHAFTLRAAAPLFENNGSIISPPQVMPQIDATNFVNRGVMNLNFPITGTFNLILQNLQYFETSSTLNFTNFNFMYCNTGFKFDTFAGGAGGNGGRRASANFNNKGTIIAGPTNNINSFNLNFGLFLQFEQSALLQVWSTNVVNSGTLGLLSDGLISIKGQNVDLTRGRLTGANTFGLYDIDWGVGTETNGSDFYDPLFAVSSTEPVTTPNGAGIDGVFAFQPNIFIWTNQFQIGTNNINIVQAVFVDTTDTNITSNVAFDLGFDQHLAVPTIQLLAAGTNSFGQQLTNEFDIQDLFAVIPLRLATRGGFYGIPPAAQNTFVPDNYFFYTSFPGFDQLDTTNSDIITTPIDYQGSNQFTIYRGLFSPISSRPFELLTYSSITNVPGRVEITADTALNLERARIDSVNYVNITSTNHFIGSTNAQIVVPFSSFDLGSTNGSMAISNLLAPVLPRMNGTIQLYSARWTTTNDLGETNWFFTTIVNPQMQPYFPSTVNNLTLRSTNLTISDSLFVTNNLLLDTERLTITTNMPGALSANGAIVSPSTNIVWSANLPRLNFFTNYGEVVVQNAAYFAGTRHSPYFDTTFEEPYQAMVNHGVIGAASLRIWANYFENTGSATVFNDFYANNVQAGWVESFSGPIEITAGRGLFANATFVTDSLFADINLGGGDLTISNMTIISEAITLRPTNSITDGGVIAQNSWNLTDSFNLVNKPATGDLLGTTVIITVTNDFAESRNFWAGENRGAGNSGFQDNVAIGHLVLDGQGFDTLFSFYGMGDNNAMYVDFLELDNFAANNVGGTNYTSLFINSNMTIYYAAASAQGVDISSALNGANGGRLVWVPSFTGAISSKFLNTVHNQTGPAINAGVKFQHSPVQKAILSWQAAANSTNYVYYCTNLLNPNWTLLTNFVQGSVTGPVSFGDNAKTNGAVYYKIRVDPRKP